MVINDTECPYWDHKSLNNTIQTQTLIYDVCIILLDILIGIMNEFIRGLNKNRFA